MADILDLDKLVEDKRTVKLEGKEIDVTKIPSKVTLTVADTWEEIDEDDPESFDKIIDIVMMIIDAQNDDITRDWLIENSSLRQLIALIEYVLEPIQEKKQQGGAGVKNGQTAQTK